MDDKDESGNYSKYTVKLVDAYVDIVWDGHITQEMAAECNTKVYEAAQALQSQHKPILLRLHTEHAPHKPNVDAFSEALKSLQTGLPIKRIVIWGKMPRLVRMLVNIALESYDTEFDIKYIEDEQTALNWLLTGQEASKA